MDFSLALSKEKWFHVVFVVVLLMMDVCSGSVLILLLFVFVRVLSFVIFCFVTRVLGLGVFFGMVGYLLLLVLVGLLLGLTRLMILLVLGWRGCWVLVLKEVCREWVPPNQFVDSVTSSDVSDHADVWTDGSFVLDELSGVGVGGCGRQSTLLPSRAAPGSPGVGSRMVQGAGAAGGRRRLASWSSRSSPWTGSPAFCGADHRRGWGGSRGCGRPCDLQRQVPAVPLLWRGRCLRFSSSPESVELPVCNETGFFLHGYGGGEGFFFAVFPRFSRSSGSSRS